MEQWSSLGKLRPGWQKLKMGVDTTALSKRSPAKDEAPGGGRLCQQLSQCVGAAGTFEDLVSRDTLTTHHPTSFRTFTSFVDAWRGAATLG